MVSTLSGLNFSLYRERLRRHNHSFISILTSCCILLLFNMNTVVHRFIQTKISSVPLTALSWGQKPHWHKLHNNPDTSPSHTLWPGWKGRLFVPPAADWTWVLQQEINWLLVFLHGSPQMSLSTTFPVGQQLEAIHKTAPPQQQIPATLMWSNKRNFLEQILTVWESPLPSGFNVMLTIPL